MTWTYRPDINRVITVDNGGCEVRCAEPFGRSAEEIAERGYLIAAAEDLMEACNAALFALTDGLDDLKPGDMDPYCAGIRQAAKRKLRAALKRARSES